MSCSACFQGSLHDGTPRGKVTKLHGLNTYVTEPTEGRPVRGIIVLIPDAFGWEFPNNRLLCDHYADKGDYRVYLPDFMNGNAAPFWIVGSLQVLTNPGNYLSKLWNLPWTVASFGSFLVLNRFGKTYPPLKAFFLALRQNEAAAESLPIGAVGLCWGGKHVALLAAEEETDSKSGKPVIDAGFTGHPSALSIPADIENMKRPVSFAIGDKDMAVGVDQAKQIKEIVEKKPEGQRGELTIYPGAGHGFCCRADTTYADINKQADAAEDQCIRWFNTHFGLTK